MPTFNDLWHLFNDGGPHLTDEVILLFRITVGVFFAISGFYKLFNEHRHATFVRTLQECGIWPGMCWFVAGVEFLGGLAVVFGVLTQLALLGLLAILVVAFVTAAIPDLRKKKLLGIADYCAVALAQAEAFYMILIVGLLLTGPGKYTLYALAAAYGIP